MTNNFKTKLFAALLLLSTFSACKKDETTDVQTENFKGIFVVNEGGFGKSNGSIGLYKPGDKSYFDAFKKANGRPLGDVVQSMALINERYYICVNNSNKIEVVSASTFKSLGSINWLSPRQVLKTSDAKAFVSNLYSNSVKVLDLSSNTISKDIPIQHNSDVLALMNGKVYASTFDNKIMVLDAASESLTDSIVTGSGLSRIVNAGNGTLAVLCTGMVDWSNGNVLENGKIQLIAQDADTVYQSVELETGSYGGSMVYSSTDANLYFSLGKNKVYKMTLSGVVSEFITLDAGQNVYGLSYSSQTGELYISDAGDFSSEGKVYIYNLSGVKTGEITAGIAPNGVLVNN